MAEPTDWTANVNKARQTRAERTAAKWNMPGGGYDEWKKGDAEREKTLPIGSTAPQRPDPARPAAKPVVPSKPKTGY